MWIMIRNLLFSIFLFIFLAVGIAEDIYDEVTEPCWVNSSGDYCFSLSFVNKINDNDWSTVKSIMFRHYGKKETVISYNSETNKFTVVDPSGKKMVFPLEVISFLDRSDYQQGSFGSYLFEHNSKSHNVFYDEKTEIFTVAKSRSEPDYIKEEDGCWAGAFDPVKNRMIYYQIDSCPDEAETLSYQQ